MLKFFVLSVFVSTAVAQEGNVIKVLYDSMLEPHRECQKNTEVTAEALEAVLFKLKLSSPKVKAYFFCMGQSIGIQDRYGNIDVGKLKKLIVFSGLIVDDEVDKVVNKCLQNNYDGSENASNTLLCLLAESHSRSGNLLLLK